MQTLNDGTEVTDRSYYYLLDWNDWNEKKFMRENFNKDILRDLDCVEYQIMFNIATSQEFPVAINQPTIIMLGSEITKAKDYLELVEKITDKAPNPPWDQSPPSRGIIHNPFVRRGHLAFIGHHLPTITSTDLPIIESPVLIKHEFMERLDYNTDKPKGRVRGQRNKDFKQSIKNLTNNRK